ncbi:ABC transporter type 1, transmembrane domain-containing protein, partial [Blyttiomyces helicus]
VTLMSTDAERIREYVAAYAHRIILEIPLSIILSFGGLFATVGWAAFAGLAAIVVLIPVGSFIGKMISDMQETLMATTDKRVNAINEMLQGIRVIKYFAWETQFIKRITAARSAEVANWTRLSGYIVYYNLFTCGTSVSVAFVTFATYILVLGHPLDASTAFTCISLLALLNESMTALPWAIGEFCKVKVSLDRISRFLAGPELERFRDERPVADHSTLSAEPTVGFRAASFKYDSTAAPDADLDTDGPASNNIADKEEQSAFPPEFHLRDIDVEFPVGGLSLVTGATGSGKSSLLLALLSECLSDKMAGDFPEMKRINGKQYLPTSHATAYVAQSAWIMNATIRDNILFGALYDAKRYQETMEACALIRDLETLEGGDLTEIGEKGVNLSGGQKARISLARAAYSYAPILLLDDPLSAVDAPTAKHLLHHCLLGVMKSRTVVLVSHAVGFVLPHVDFALVLKAGRVTAQGTPAELVRNPAADAVFGLELAAASDRDELAATETAAAALEGTGATLVDDEARAIGSVSWAVYWSYTKAAGALLFVSVYVFAFFAMNCVGLLDSVWILYWTDNMGESAPPVDRADLVFFLAVYSIIGVSIIAMSTAQLALILYGRIRAGTTMHADLLASILGAPMRFFEVTPVGRILNRYSPDADPTPRPIPTSPSSTASQVFRIIFILGVIAFEAPLFIVAAVPLIYTYQLTAKFYLLASRELKRLESISRSPLFSQFSETLAGVETVRAYGVQRRLLADVHDRIDGNHRAYFLLWAANRWLCVRTDMLGAMVTLAAGLVVVSGSLTPGLAGLILVYALEFSDALSWAVREHADMEMAMNSVERVAEYTATEQEPPAIIEKSRPS